MPNFRMKPEWLGNEPIPYECRYCPSCSALNWIAGQNPEPCAKFDTEAVQCWKCGDVFWVDSGYEEEYQGNFINALICHGQPDPVIPTDILTTVIDAAAEHFEEVKSKIRTLEEDSELVDVVNEVRDAINFVKKFLAEGDIPQYNPPTQGFSYEKR